jgi:hypothetical protein
MIRVVLVVARRIDVAMTAHMKMWTRGLIFRFRHFHAVMDVRQAQALVGQHQKTEQEAKESTDHTIIPKIIFFQETASEMRTHG